MDKTTWTYSTSEHEYEFSNKKAPNFFGAFSIFVRVIWENSGIVSPFDPSRIGIR